MSWDNYDQYGNYSDQQYSAAPAPQAPAASAPAPAPAQNYYDPNQSSYDIYGGYQPNPGPGPAAPPTSQASAPAGYYQPPPQHYSQQQMPSQVAPAQMPATSQSGQFGGQPARQTPLPSGPGGNFPIPGLGDQVNPMVANMAMQYGQDIMGKGQEEIKKNLDKYVSLGQLKYYFAVDTSYVGKKLALLLFPFTQSDWSIRYNQDEPVQPKFDVNAPDLYIPSQAYVTFVLLVGYVLGLRQAFSPELLGRTASSNLVYLILEIGIVYLTLTLMNISTNLCKWDVLAFSTYKYVAMVGLLLLGLVGQTSKMYYAGLAYLSAALAFFLVRTLKLRIEPEVHGMQVHGKRKLYIILLYAGLQPLLMWWMTYHFIPDLPAAAAAADLGGMGSLPVAPDASAPLADAMP